MNAKLWLLPVLVLFLGTGCAYSKVNVIKAVNVETCPSVCVVQNPGVRDEVLSNIEKWLIREERKYKIVPTLTAAESCACAMQYDGRFSWDFSLLLGYSSIRLLKDGETVGLTEFTAPAGSWGDKWKSTEDKIFNQLDQLFGPTSSLDLESKGPDRKK